MNENLIFVQSLLPYVQLAVSIGTLIGMLYAFKKFLNAPQNTLEQRVAALEVKVAEHETSLNASHDKHRESKRIDSLIINSLIALIEFETDYCLKHGGEDISPGLLEAKKKLYEFLAEN
jgi:hypothetical protein